MRKLYKDIQMRIDSLDFNTLWKGFYPCEFALYNDERVYFATHDIHKTDQFIGNTAISYEGKHIAIWKVENEDIKDVDVLASLIIHEMFHAYQYAEGDNRFYSDLKALSYPLEFQNMNIKYNESRLLISAYQASKRHEKCDYFSKFVSLREHRFSRIGDHSLYEKSIETIEGSAEFVGLKALKILNVQAYNRQIDKVMDWINTINESFLDVRRTSYYIGALMCLVAEDLQIDFQKALEPNLAFNYDLMRDSGMLDLGHPLVISDFLTIQDAINDRSKSISAKVTAIKTHPDVSVYKGDFTIVGYDPMNMRRFENDVYHRHFIGILENGKTEFVMGEIVIETDGHDFSKFSTYYKVTKPDN